MTRVVLATRNAHKVEELREILGDVCVSLDLEIVGLDQFADAPEVVEDGV
ncbi:MAG: non-canonical purine NTP pyrophosphatase, partial [Humibacillus sp.]